MKTNRDNNSQAPCARCGGDIVREEGSCGTGYASLRTGGKEVRVCYACCAEIDKKAMARHGRATLYLSKVYAPEGQGLGSDWPHEDRNGRRYRWEVTNWPGTLRLRCGVREGRHNICGKRYDAWFTFGGYVWHGVNLGDNQLLRCRRTKEAA